MRSLRQPSASWSCCTLAGVAPRDDDGALEHLGPEEGLHQLVVGTVAEHLGLDADGGGVLDRVAGPLAGELCRAGFVNPRSRGGRKQSSTERCDDSREQEGALSRGCEIIAADDARG